MNPVFGDHDLPDRKEIREFFRYLDTGYSYRLAKQMEKFRTNETLGYRTAGSRAEYLTGEMLCREMREIGLDVTKDAFTLDGWDFRHARLYFRDTFGKEQMAELGSYQTDFHTQGKKLFRLINAGRGTAEELNRLDVRGKLVLIEIDQRGEWWINYPTYQAHLHGAAAVIAVQNDGYGQIHPDSLNAQNICGPSDAPAFSLSMTDARRINLAFGEEREVWFDAESSVIPKAVSYNIVGKLEGEDKDSLILMSAHYDSYFEGFQDDNTAVSMMLCIARAIVKSGYRPRKTLLFCAMAAEEWGVINSRYDWSTGAYNEVFGVHPEWQGKTVLDINLELPAHPHGKRHEVRSVWEYQPFLSGIVDQILPENTVYPEKARVVCPIQTWSDDFSLSISGIPSLVNNFVEGSFMETHYHSQFDSEESYDEDVYSFHHQLYGRILLEYDRLSTAPLDFSVRIRALAESVEAHTPEADAFCKSAREILPLADRLACYVENLNLSGKTAPKLPGRCSLNRTLLTIFRFCEDCFVRLTWEDVPIFPHEYAQENLKLLAQASELLENGDPHRASDILKQIDNNAYACSFEREVFDYFTDYVVNQPADRLTWGAGRIVGHVMML